jgi:hypothetical protein
MTRLFTFGCSFTATEHYPSWSAFLGLEFEHYENWGVSGIGCKAIAERVAECHSKNKFNKDDIVVVQWTTHLRHDYYTTKNSIKEWNGWQTGGNMFNHANRAVFTDKFVEDFFYEPAYVMHCLNEMVLVQALLESTGCTWYMTSIGEWPLLCSDIWEDVKPVDIRKEIPMFQCYYDSIWKDHVEHWLEPIGVHAKQSPELIWFFKDENKNNEWYQEPHPSPQQNANWLNDCLRPKLGLGEPPKEQKLWLDQLTRMKEENNHYCLSIQIAYMTKEGKEKYGKEFWPSQELWPLKYIGF